MGEQKTQLTETQQCFLDILKSVFTHQDIGKLLPAEDSYYAPLIQMAQTQHLSSLLYAYIYEYHSDDCPMKWKQIIEQQGKQVILVNYRLWQQTLHIYHLLEANHIPCIVLKGPSLASYYEIPELRKAGDVDIWVYQPNSLASKGEVFFGPVFQRIEQIMSADGYQMTANEHSNYHKVFEKQGLGEVEVHSSWVDRFPMDSMNRDIAELAEMAYDRAKPLDVFEDNKVLVLSEEDQACHMLLHMLQHYMMKGFGLKFLCDWTAFWSHKPEEKVYYRFLEMVSKWHLETFVSHITSICVEYLGLDEQAASPLIQVEIDRTVCVELLVEMFESGEFGKTEEGRMVALEGIGPFELFKEVHFQMKRNHGNRARNPWLWPYLWLITLFGFMWNNHRVRNISTWKILRSAGQRARVRRKMKLFKDVS